MKSLRLTPLIILFLVVFGIGSLAAQDNDTSLVSDQDELLETLDVTEVIPGDNLVDLIVVPEQPRVGVVSPYLISFKIEQFTYDLIKNGGLRFAFPVGFDLTRIETISISDNYVPLELEVEKFEVSAQLLTVHLQQIRFDEVTTLDDPVYVEVTFAIADIGNPQEVGNYQIAAVAFKQNNAIVAGPVFSQPFSILTTTLESIVVTPSEDITRVAGDVVSFSAEGFDAFGNKIDGLTFSWSLDCDDCIGFMTDSTFTATTPGTARVLASFGGISGSSGLITVVPGDLARMQLAISDTQFVSHPLRGSGSISLYDAYDNLVIDYSLSQQPISLAVESGIIVPDVLSNDGLFTGGVVDLLAAGITYGGLSATVGITADNGAVFSNTVPVSFNGYDILDALDISGQTISHVYVDGGAVFNIVNVVISRQGNMAPTGFVTVAARFLSDPSGASIATPAEQLNEGTDSVTITLPDIVHASNEDTVLITLTAEFSLDGTTYMTSDTALFPVDIIELTGFSFVEGSFRPDTVVEDMSFGMSFEVFSEGFSLPVDSVDLKIRLWDAVGGNQLAVLYEGDAVPSIVGNGTLSFDMLEAIIASSTVVSDNYYPIDVLLSVFSGSTIMSLDDRWVDSIFVRGRPELTVDPSTVQPTSVSAGSIAEFRFILTAVTQSPLDFISSGSSFTVSGSGFSTSTSLNLTGSRIDPGENVLTTEGVFIPTSQLGNALDISAEIRYSIPGVSGEHLFATDFDQVQISVTALPAIKVIEVEAMAPNTPKVNTGQQFQIAATIANVSPTPVSALQVTLTSDGSSIFEHEPFLVDLGTFDTTTIFWDVTAASEPNPAEIFIVTVDPRGISLMPAEDNVALVTIETAADLELTYSVFGVENGLIDYGNELTLTVELVNYGMAEVASTEYLLVAEGFDTNGPDTLSGGVSVDRHIDFSFIAPQRDTTLNLYFTLTGAPVDLNTLTRAQIGDTSFAVSVNVISAEAALYIEVTPIGTNLVLPGREKEIVQLDLTNTGISSATRLQLEELILVVKDGRGNPLEAMSLFSIGNSGFYEDGSKVSTVTAGDSALVFGFDEFILEPQQTRTLVFKAELRETSVEAVILELTRDGVVAKFIEGPNAGLSPAISSNVQEGESLLTEALTIKDASLEGSFMIETNPFNPEDQNESPVSFSYELPANVDVEFRIFTITGEEVYSRNYEAGQQGGLAGENVIEWDGRNDERRIVLNGVYVALMKNMATGETARIKIAVVK